MRHRATAGFWKRYDALPGAVRRGADKNFELLKADPRHPSLRLKLIGELWSVRAGLDYRALALEQGGELHWFWIGTHAEYDRVAKRR